MPLREQLDARRCAAKDRFSPEDLAIMRRATVDLRDSGILDRALKVGDSAPVWELPRADGSTPRSHDLLTKGPLVLTFFRGVW